MIKASVHASLPRLSPTLFCSLMCLSNKCTYLHTALPGMYVGALKEPVWRGPCQGARVADLLQPTGSDVQSWAPAASELWRKLWPELQASELLLLYTYSTLTSACHRLTSQRL